MNCCIAFCLFFFIIPNLVVMLAGGFACVTSLLALFMPSLLLPAYRAYFHALYKDVYRSSDNQVDACYSENWATNDSVLVIDWLQIPLAKYLLAVIAAIGAWLFVWAFWGFVSLCRCCHKCFLVLYTIVQIVTLIALPVVLLLAYVPFKAQLVDALATSLNSTMEKDYFAKPDKSCTSFKLAFDAVQYQGYCCAVHGYSPDTDQRLNYSPVCSAGTFEAGKNTNYQAFPGCFAVVKTFLERECLLWLGIGIGVVCVLFLVEIITGLVCVGLWRREDSSSMSMMGGESRSRNYLASERDGFISDKDMEQYYAPGQFSAPTTTSSTSHHNHHRHGRK